MTIRWFSLLLLLAFTLPCKGEVPLAVKRVFSQLVPGEIGKNITEAPLPGWFQGQVGSRLFYVDSTGEFLLDGQVFNLKTRTNLTAIALNTFRQELLSGVDEASMVLFKAPDERYRVSVFTDVDCGYCRKLHNSMADYHRLGISVQYLAYPRAGMGTPTARIMESAWCADDPVKALTRAKQGKKIKQLECTNPIIDHYRLGNALGVKGTPAILLESGHLVPGFVEAPQLLQMLEQG